MIEKKVREFWDHIHNADFDRLEEVMSNDANVILPNTKEIFRGSSNYIQFNKDYPGRWFARIEKILSVNNEVISVVEVSNNDGVNLYVNSFFRFEDGMIQEVTEYWGENGEAPKWRQDKGYSEVY